MQDSPTSQLFNRSISSVLQHTQLSRAPAFFVTSLNLDVRPLLTEDDGNPTSQLSDVIGSGYSGVSLSGHKSERLNDMQVFSVGGGLRRAKAQLGQEVTRGNVPGAVQTQLRSRVQDDVLEVVAPEGLFDGSQDQGGGKIAVISLLIPTSRGGKTKERGNFRQRFLDFVSSKLEGFSLTEHPNSPCEIGDDWLCYSCWGTKMS